jgi:16S rRNA (guanine527-N7)-methyltransferase
VALVESNGKKARFLREAARRLGLADIEIVEARAEEGPGARPRVAQVISRALAALPMLCRLAEPWLVPGGQLLAMKGPGWREEQVGLPPGWRIEAAHDLAVPGLEAARHLVILSGPAPAAPRAERP